MLADWHDSKAAPKAAYATINYYEAVTRVRCESDLY
jgi:hypothetical protein